MVNSVNDTAYKVAYRKAYSDISQAFMQALSDGSLTPRTDVLDTIATAADWAVLKAAFKVTQDCAPAQLNSCWSPGDNIFGMPNNSLSPSFVDASGRSWALYYDEESIFFVDTNGFKSPNQFGKDRMLFRFLKKDDSNVVVGLPDKVTGWYQDITTTGNGRCNFPPCYYRSWLFN